MNFLKVTIFTLAICCLVSANHIRRQHKFLGLDSLNPMQTIQLMSGDWTAILPQSIRGFAKQLLGQQSQTGASGLLSQAQSLLGGSSGGNPLSGLLGGLTGGSGNGTSSGLGSMLGGLSGLSSIFGGQQPPANTGLSGLLGGLTGGSGNNSSTGSSILNGLSNAFGGSQQPQTTPANGQNGGILNTITNAIGGGSSSNGATTPSSGTTSNGFGLSTITGMFSHEEQVHKAN